MQISHQPQRALAKAIHFLQHSILSTIPQIHLQIAIEKAHERSKHNLRRRQLESSAAALPPNRHHWICEKLGFQRKWICTKTESKEKQTSQQSITR